jgi:hypothetical protein
VIRNLRIEAGGAPHRGRSRSAAPSIGHREVGSRPQGSPRHGGEGSRKGIPYDSARTTPASADYPARALRALPLGEAADLRCPSVSRTSIRGWAGPPPLGEEGSRPVLALRPFRERTPAPRTVTNRAGPCFRLGRVQKGMRNLPILVGAVLPSHRSPLASPTAPRLGSPDRDRAGRFGDPPLHPARPVHWEDQKSGSSGGSNSGAARARRFGRPNALRIRCARTGAVTLPGKP